MISSDGSDNDDADLANRRLMATVAGISLAGSVLVVVLSVLFGRLNRACWRAVSFGCIAEIVFTGSLLIGDANWDELGAPNSAICGAEGFILTLSSISLNSWLLFIALSLLFLVRRSAVAGHSFADRFSTFLGSWRGELSWFLAWLGIGLIFAVLPLAHVGGLYYARVRSGWCHIAPHPAWARFLLYPVQWGIIAAIIALYIAVFVVVRQRFPQQRIRVMLPQRELEKRRRVFAMLKQIQLYPAILLISWLPTTIARIVGAASGGHDLPWMSTLTAAVVPMMGILIFCCFLATSRVPQDIWNRLSQWLCSTPTPDGASSITPGSSTSEFHQPLINSPSITDVSMSDDDHTSPPK